MPSTICSGSFGHNAHGINIQNLRALVTDVGPTNTLLPGGLRTDHAWKKEVEQTRKDSEYRGQLTSRLREANKAAQAAAEERVADGVGRVEAALKSKLGQVQQQADALQAALRSISTESGKLARADQRLASMQAHLQDKLAVNRSRQQARRNRPVREMTCDEVARSLSRQEALLANLLHKLQRGSALVAVDSSKLQDVRQRVARSLSDKVASLKVDEAVLNVTAPAAAATEGPDRPPESNLLTSLLSSASSKATAQEAVGSGSGSASTLRQAGLGAARASCSGLYPSKWQKATQQLVAEAEQTVADSSRLRKGVKQMLCECLAASQSASTQVDAAMAAKLASTGHLHDQLSAQLQIVQEEIEVAKEHQDTLQTSLHAKQAPLQQLEARLALRAGRPVTEDVEDEVQAALAAEAAQLKGVSSQLHARVDAAGQQIAQLNSVSVALLQHIADKQTAMSLEERVALMDGRKLVGVPPSPTVLSVCSSVVSGYSGLGESASQISAAASHAGSATGSCRRPKAPSSCAGSTTSSALVRTAALEKELAAVKSESAQLRAMVGGKGREA